MAPEPLSSAKEVCLLVTRIGIRKDGVAGGARTTIRCLLTWRSVGVALLSFEGEDTARVDHL